MKCLNVVFPAKEALNFMGNYQSLIEINVLAGRHLRDERLKYVCFMRALQRRIVMFCEVT